jgi:hypothetical protein
VNPLQNIRAAVMKKLLRESSLGAARAFDEVIGLIDARAERDAQSLRIYSMTGEAEEADAEIERLAARELRTLVPKAAPTPGAGEGGR